MHTGIIGIVGGVGPYAGLDLTRKIFDQTEASRDQDHLPVVLFSLPGSIADRTRFLLGEIEENAGDAIGEILLKLATAGATVAGIPCNTAHSPRILEPALLMLREAGTDVRFVHMIDEVIRWIREQLPEATRIGVLSTLGTYETGLYQDALLGAGLEPLFPDAAGRQRVQEAISSPVYGIKAQSSPVTPEARRVLEAEAEQLAEQGAQGIILGCTELPLALTAPDVRGVPLIDATHVLARALILAFAPEKLKR